MAKSRILFDPPKSPYRVDFDGKFRIADATTKPPEDVPQGKKGKKRHREKLAEEIVDAFLTTPFGGGRHARRVAMIETNAGEGVQR